METTNLLFLVFSAMAIGFALMTVLGKHPVSSAFSLVMVFFSFAGIYAVLGAHLVATLQILLYAGAIMVLFIFVIMLLGADEASADLARSHRLFVGIAGLSVVGLLGVLIHIFVSADFSMLTQGVHTPEMIAANGGNTRVLATLMFSEYLLPFELVSILLLAAIIAAVAIAKRHSPRALNSQGRAKARLAAAQQSGGR